MAQTVCVMVSALDRQRLEAITSDRKRQRKHVERARVVLASAGGRPVQQVATQVGVSRPMVWRWQQRFAEAGVDGLLRDKTRKPGKAADPGRDRGAGGGADLRRPASRGDALDRPRDGQGAGISLRSVQRIWEAHQLQPHRVRSFKRSRDPQFAEKLVDIVGLYVDPPAHAVVLSIDEKSQIQALDRTQPGLPLKPGRCGTMTHDYKRHGTTTLFAALNVLDGTVIGRCMQRHRHQEFIRFLNAVERDGPGRQADRGRGRQLRHPQASQGQGLAGAPSALDLPLHADLRLLAQRGRDLLLGPDPQAHPTRQLPLHRRPAGRHQPLPRRAQRRSQALRLDSLRRFHPRQARQAA